MKRIRMNTPLSFMSGKRRNRWDTGMDMRLSLAYETFAKTTPKRGVFCLRSEHFENVFLHRSGAKKER